MIDRSCAWHCGLAAADGDVYCKPCRTVMVAGPWTAGEAWTEQEWICQVCGAVYLDFVPGPAAWCPDCERRQERRPAPRPCVTWWCVETADGPDLYCPNCRAAARRLPPSI